MSLTTSARTIWRDLLGAGRRSDGPVRTYLAVLDDLEQQAAACGGSFAWNEVTVTLRSESPAADGQWKPWVARLEKDLRRRLGGLDCELPEPFRLRVELRRNAASVYAVEKRWQDVQGPSARLLYREETILLSGRRLAYGRRPEHPESLVIDVTDLSVSRTQGIFQPAAQGYALHQYSQESTTRIVRGASLLPVIRHAPRLLQFGDRIVCGKGRTEILYVAPCAGSSPESRTL